MTSKVMIGAAQNASVVTLAGLALAALVPMIVGFVFLRKKFMGRVILFTLFAGVVWTAETWWLTVVQPETFTSLALQQMSGGDSVAARVRMLDAGKDAVHVVA